MRAHTVPALLGLILVAYSGNPALGQDLTGADIATQPFFHFRTNYVELCGGADCGEDVGTYWAYGNLWTFTHPGTPGYGQITGWSVEPTGTRGRRGAFTVFVDRPNTTAGPILGEIFFRFEVQVEWVPPLYEGENEHFNFQGPIQIVGGTGFYEGIKGHGTMSGTWHNHWEGSDPPRTWLDFVVLGRAGF